MKTFKQFIIEMPQASDSISDYKFSDGDYDPIKSSGLDTWNNQNHEHLRSYNGHDYWKSSEYSTNRDSNLYDTIHVTDAKTGHVKFKINGSGNSINGTFIVHNTESNKKRNENYSNVIANLVRNDHVREWHSDLKHSEGSKMAYRRLIDQNKDLKMEHQDSDTGIRYPVSPENIHQFENKPGRFIVSKR